MGHVQRIRQKENQKWVRYMQSMDLLIRLVQSGKKNSDSIFVYEVFLSWLSKSTSNLKFKYDKSDSKWIDLNAVISTMTLTYNEA